MALGKNATTWIKCHRQWKLDYNHGRGSCSLPIHADRWLSYHIG
jgi:hypothetical protein